MSDRPDINTTEGRMEMISDDVRDTIASGGVFDPGDPEHVYNDTMAIVDGLSSSPSSSDTDTSPPSSGSGSSGGSGSDTPEPAENPF